jgi:transcription elongation factor GreA
MHTKFPITPEGYKLLNKDLAHLKEVERPNIIQAVAEARAHGDLKENAEYSSAKEKQGFIEARIADLESKQSHAEIIDYTIVQSDKVQFGAKVTLMDYNNKLEISYRIVGDYEANIEKKMVSILSPIARALLGKAKGDEIEVFTPKGDKYYEVLEITY